MALEADDASAPSLDESGEAGSGQQVITEQINQDDGSVSEQGNEEEGPVSEEVRAKKAPRKAKAAQSGVESLEGEGVELPEGETSESLEGEGVESLEGDELDEVEGWSLPDIAEFPATLLITNATPCKTHIVGTHVEIEAGATDEVTFETAQAYQRFTDHAVQIAELKGWQQGEGITAGVTNGED